MARLFDGTDDKITLNLGNMGFVFGPGTMVFIIRRNNTGVSQRVCHFGANTGTARFGIRFNSTNDFSAQIGSTLQIGPFTVTETGWILIAVTKTSGTTAPRYHKYVFATNTWTHTDGAAIADSTAPTGTASNLGALVTSEFFNGDMLIGALYDVALSDAQIESLPFALQAWWGPKTPRALWLLDHQSTGQVVTDITGGGANQNAIVGTAVATNHPPIWNRYDDAIAVTRQAAAGTPVSQTMAAVLEALGCLAGTKLEPLESLGCISASRLDPLEALARAAATRADPLEALAGVAAVRADPFEALGLAASTRLDAFEALAAIAAAKTEPFEALGRAASTRLDPFESLLAAAQTRPGPLEALAAAAKAAQAPYEAQGQIIIVQAALLPFEALSARTAPAAAILEALAARAAAAVGPYEAVRAAAAVRIVPLEALRGLAATRPLALEALARRGALVLVPFETENPPGFVVAALLVIRHRPQTELAATMRPLAELFPVHRRQTEPAAAIRPAATLAPTHRLAAELDPAEGPEG